MSNKPYSLRDSFNRWAGKYNLAYMALMAGGAALFSSLLIHAVVDDDLTEFESRSYAEVACAKSMLDEHSLEKSDTHVTARFSVEEFNNCVDQKMETGEVATKLSDLGTGVGVLGGVLALAGGASFAGHRRNEKKNGNTPPKL